MEVARVCLWYLRLHLLFECNFLEDICSRVSSLKNCLSDSDVLQQNTSPPSSKQHALFNPTQVFISHRKLSHRILSGATRENTASGGTQGGGEPNVRERREMKAARRNARAASKRNRDFDVCALCHSHRYKQLEDDGYAGPRVTAD